MIDLEPEANTAAQGWRPHTVSVSVLCAACRLLLVAPFEASLHPGAGKPAMSRAPYSTNCGFCLNCLKIIMMKGRRFCTIPQTRNATQKTRKSAELFNYERCNRPAEMIGTPPAVSGCSGTLFRRSRRFFPKANIFTATKTDVSG